MLKLIYGASGSGKTKHIIDCLRHDAESGKHAYLIVPEQQAFICERTVLPQLPPSAGLNIEIMSFSRLAESVFRKYGGITYTNVSHGIRSLVMWMIIRELSPLLEEYRNVSMRDKDFCEMMLKETDELSSCGITAADLERASEQLESDSPLRRRLRDIALIYASYENILRESVNGIKNSSGNGIVCVTDTLTRLYEVLDTTAKDCFAGCNFYIDSFSGFTHEEYMILRKIFERAEDITVTLCTDRTCGMGMCTKGIELTVGRIKNLADRVGLGVEETLLTLPRDTDGGNSELNILRKELWNFENPDSIVEEPEKIVKGQITICRCPNPYAEFEIAAINILSLVQSGMKFGDIAVIARDAESYSGIIESVFEKYRIPFFLSERTDIMTKPLTKHLIYALKVITSGYRLTDVLTLARTGFYDATPEETDLFEEYCTTWNIRGIRFREKAWSMNPDGYTTFVSSRGKRILAAANKVRALIFDPLIRLADALSVSADLAQMCDALRSYMKEINVREYQKMAAEYELEHKNYKEAGEALRLYEFIIGALNDISSVFPDTKMSIDEFACALSIVFSKTDIGSVPAVSDYVTVGSASMLRLENIKATLLVGLNEGEFPQTVKDSGLLSDAEKQTLLDLGIEIDSRNEILSSDELFFVMRTMTKPSEKLFLSYHTSGIGGGTYRPSIVIPRVKKLFGYIQEKDFTKSSFCRPGLPDSEQNTQVLPSTVSDFYGETLSLTQEKLKSFVQCPYRYYCTYVLKLREKKVAQIGYSDAGTFVHYILENYVKSITENGTHAPQIPPEDELSGIVNTFIEGYVGIICPAEFFPDGIPVSMAHRFARLRILATVLVQSVNEEFSKSRFRPEFFELIIGNGEGNVKPYEIQLKNGKKVCITGKIDRVDLFKKDGQIYVRVVDYKSGDKTLSLSKVKSGEDLQLLLYLFTLCKNGSSEWSGKENENSVLLPAGAVYLSMRNVKSKDGSAQTEAKRNGIVLADDEVLSAMNEEMNAKFISGVSKAGGGISERSVRTAEQFNQLWDEICLTVSDIASEMCSGVAVKKKSEQACKFCRVADYCAKN